MPRVHVLEKIEELFSQKGGSLYGGEAVTQEEHALQAAKLAEESGASPALIASALLHDVVHILRTLPEAAPHVFVDQHTLQVTGLIEFERAMWADPLMEINFALKGDDPSYIEGYGRAIYTDAAGRLRRSLYDLYLATIMVVESTFRQYTDPSNESWGRMWLDATLPKLT